MTQANENINGTDGWKNIIANLGLQSNNCITPIDMFASDALKGMLAACSANDIERLSAMGEEGDYLMAKRAWGFAKAMIRVRSDLFAEFKPETKLRGGGWS